MKEHLKINNNKLNVLWYASIILAFFSHFSRADTFQKPDKCPEVEAIRQVGVDFIVLVGNDAWAAGNLSNKYGTAFDWTLSLGGTNEKVKSEPEAHQKALDELQTLTFIGGPYYSADGNAACLYDTKKIKGAITITPPLKPSDTILFKH